MAARWPGVDCWTRRGHRRWSRAPTGGGLRSAAARERDLPVDRERALVVEQLAPAQGNVQPRPAIGQIQRVAEDLLDALEPVIHRSASEMQQLSHLLLVAVGLQKGVERAHELGAV